MVVCGIGVVFQMKCVPIYIAVIDVEMPKSGSSSSKLGMKWWMCLYVWASK